MESAPALVPVKSEEEINKLIRELEHLLKEKHEALKS